MGTSKMTIPVPLFDLKFLDGGTLLAPPELQIGGTGREFASECQILNSTGISYLLVVLYF